MLRRPTLYLVGWLAAASAAVPPPGRPVLSQLNKNTRQQQQLSLEQPKASTLVAASVPGCSIRDLVVQIVNNVAGAGILTLSAGMAAGVGWVPASVLCVLLGALSGVTFHLIGAACEMTGQSSFKGLWDATLGEKSAWLVDLSIALMCLSAAIIYAGILGDTSTQLLTLAGLPEALNRRTLNIGLLTLGALTPLSLLEDVSALAFTSLLGVIAVLYTATFIVLRSLDGSYALPKAAAQAGGHLARSLPPQVRLDLTWLDSARRGST
jgi:amino acid permease